MKVILKQDVKKVGKKGEVVEVSDGYARNFLIARGLAVQSTKKSMEILGEQKAEEAALEAKREEEARQTAALLETMTLDFHVKSGAEGRVFGSVSTKQIAEELAKKNIKIDKKKILDTAPIQSLGTTKVRVELHKNVIGVINVKLIGSNS
ncbi:MAG TPA: 50S ribosomal protein L9 [Erysipelotrichaceae bacterium]|nr:50S ribosomal protein L9 [Erysipelotrichaceae bacterium]